MMTQSLIQMFDLQKDALAAKIDELMIFLEKQLTEQPKKRFLLPLEWITTVATGVRTKSSDINAPAIFKNLFIIDTLILIAASSTIAGAVAAGDRLYAGVEIDGKPLCESTVHTVLGSSQVLDLLPIPLIVDNVNNYITGSVKYELHSEIFGNSSKLNIIYMNKSSNANHFAITAALGGYVL